ncbi:endopeptidase La [Fusobacterium sp. IOR10]|uniref:endopeptidase La n=1 Tax=Fusobacterium sp. IOR10 TaxID=2665157 RepID=UPI0013D51576|nr:endopeptidase La [Fusobacterium sp. IOR10]
MSNRIAFLPTRDLIAFPGAVRPLYVGREKSLKTIKKLIKKGETKLLLVSQKKMEQENPSFPEDVYQVGVIANILQEITMPNETVKLLIEVEKKVIVENIKDEDGDVTAEYTVVEPDTNYDKETMALYRKIVSKFEDYIDIERNLSKEVLISLEGSTNVEANFDLICNNLKIENKKKQLLLEKFNAKERGFYLLEILLNEMEMLRIETNVEEKVRKKIDAAQKAYYIKEKINALKDELGGEEEISQEDDEILKRLEKAKLPVEVRKKIEAELKKVSKMPSFSAEASVSRNYIDVLLDLPWGKSTKDHLDIVKANRILERDHYGLKEVKNKVLDYLAVKKLNPKMKGTILCLVGPPGVGKTSIAKSVADAMGRKFVRVSLGGVRDEAEIRGHRRTYIGSMPGRIMKAMKIAGTKNPLILLDELDKMASDFKGDPASAMLEVLDPEQNIHFEDHYVDYPFDLSDVFFLGTANDLRNIPRPLIDRMEIVSISSYTEFEKLNIAKKYIVKKLQKENGLEKIKINISDKVILKIINEYTREAGVRNLKREINNLFRKLARKVINEKVDKISVTVTNLEKYLGKPKFRLEKLKEKQSKVGIVNGLAWTSVGGVTLEVQGVLIPGKGNITLTGTLGDVMKESAQVAFTYVKSNFEKYNIKSEDFLQKKNIHLHFPEGATPKDGPSAGITIVTAILSVLTGRKIRQDVAMTGEVTITGEVLAIGGVKEKVIGAHRAGIREVILPDDNRVDVDEIPQEVLKEMKINFAKTYDDVEKIVFENN